jgi:hypothetical protein
LRRLADRLDGGVPAPAVWKTTVSLGLDGKAIRKLLLDEKRRNGGGDLGPS